MRKRTPPEAKAKRERDARRAKAEAAIPDELLEGGWSGEIAAETLARVQRD